MISWPVNCTPITAIIVDESRERKILLVNKNEEFRPCATKMSSQGSATIAASCGSMLQQSQESPLTSLLGHIDVGRTLSSTEGRKPSKDLLAGLFIEQKEYCQFTKKGSLNGPTTQISLRSRQLQWR